MQVLLMGMDLAGADWDGPVKAALQGKQLKTLQETETKCLVT